MLNYPLVASKVMMKVKGHWPSASTDEPQVLALAELLQDARIGREEDALRAVTELAKTEQGRRNDFRPTPAMLCDMAKNVRRDRHQKERGAAPVVDHTAASPERRQSAIAQIKEVLEADDLGIENPRRELGSYDFTTSHAELLTTESRQGGVAEEEYVQWRWCFEPPPDWKTQATCGPWVNSQVEALNDGKAWLAAANRQFG